MENGNGVAAKPSCRGPMLSTLPLAPVTICTDASASRITAGVASHPLLCTGNRRSCGRKRTVRFAKGKHGTDHPTVSVDIRARAGHTQGESNAS